MNTDTASRIQWVKGWDEPHFKTFYSGDPNQCDYHAIWYGNLNHPHKWSVYVRADCGRFGVHFDKSRKLYDSLESIDAAITAITTGKEHKS